MAAKLVGQNDPSVKPMTARIMIRLRKPVARPERPESNENSTMAGIRTLRWPILSERPPIRAAKNPQRETQNSYNISQLLVAKTQVLHHCRKKRRDDPAVQTYKAESQAKQGYYFPFVRSIPPRL